MRRLVTRVFAAGAFVLAASGSGLAPPVFAAGERLSTALPAGFPAPLAGSVVYSREDKRDALALGVVSHGSRFVARVSVLDGQGYGADNLSVSVSLGGRTDRASTCGPGCYQASFPLHGRPAAVTVAVDGGGATTRWRVALPSVWPVPGGARLMARAGAVWRSLRTLTFVDRLAGAPHEEVTSNWRIVAPDRVAYVIPGGSAGIIIGGRRWDRSARGSWVESVQDPALHQPVPFWVSVRDAHVLGEDTFAGHASWRISFFDPGTPAWFQVQLDKKTLHTLDLRMITTAHFMHDTYLSFDEPVVITPPSQ